MADSTGTPGYGTTFEYGAADPPATLLAQVRNVSVGGITVEDLDISNFDSPDHYREFIAGFIDGGTIDIEGIYKKAGVTALVTLLSPDYTTTGNFYFQITWADGSYFDWRGYCNNIGIATPLDGDTVNITATFKIANKPTFTEGA